MDPLRWVLLGIGIAIIAAIWFHGRHRRAVHEESLLESARRSRAGGDIPSDASTPEDVDEPELPDLDIDPEDFEHLIEWPEAASGAHEEPADNDEPAVARVRERVTGAVRGLRQRIQRGERREGNDDESSAGHSADPGDSRIVALYVVAADEWLDGRRIADAFDGLQMEFGRYDIYHRFDGHEEPVFSVASMVEPGTFDPQAMNDMRTPGLALFARLPGPVHAVEAFDDMVAAARALAGELDARLLDEDRSTWTRQTEQVLRDELREFEARRQRLGR